MLKARKNTFQSRIKKLAATFVTGGTDPVKASLSIAFGFFWGVFPVVGTSTVLCAITTLALKLNLAIIQAINYLVYPIQIALLIPYLYIGSFITKAEVTTDILEKIKAFTFTLSGIKGLSGELLMILLNMLVGWLAVIPLSSLLIFNVSRFILSRYPHKGTT